MESAITRASDFAPTSFPSGRIYENIVTNGGNVRFGDTYLLNDETFRTSSLEQKRSALLGALEYTNSGAKRAQLLLHDIGIESYSWIESTALFSWLRSPDVPLFHLVGKPASGKSTLMKYLTDSRKVKDELATTGKTWTIVHYFFDFRGGDTPANDPVGMVKLFIRQFMSISPEAERFLLSHDTVERLERADLSTCIDVLTEVVALRDCNICAFIDGLDEYNGSLWTLCSHLEVIRHRTGMKMCLASRPEPEILKACSSCPSLVMQEHNQKSIRIHVRRRLDEISAFEPEIETLFTPKICDDLVRKADGVILWARLALDELLLKCEEGATAKTLSCYLGNLDPDLGHVYERILEIIPQRLKPDAALVLLLLTECAPQWENRESVLIEAIKFVQTRYSTRTFLGGSLDDDFMKTKLAIYLPNLVFTVSYHPTFSISYKQIRLIHLSLVTYLRKSGWMTRYLDTGFRMKHGTDPCRSFLCEILTAASLENAIDLNFVNEHLRREQYRGRNEHGFLVVYKNRSRHDCKQASWHGFADLLVHTIKRIPDILLKYDLDAQQERVDQCREMLNLSCMTWHFVVCKVCRLYFNHRNTKEFVYLKDIGRLDLAIALAHAAEWYINTRLQEPEYVPLNVAQSLLRIRSYFDCYSPWSEASQSGPMIVPLCTHMQTLLRKADVQLSLQEIWEKERKYVLRKTRT